jgi:hypothetical protein
MKHGPLSLDRAELEALVQLAGKEGLKFFDKQRETPNVEKEEPSDGAAAPYVFTDPYILTGEDYGEYALRKIPTRHKNEIEEIYSRFMTVSF